MKPPPIRILDDAFLDRLSAEAAAAPRRRKNFNLHAAAPGEKAAFAPPEGDPRVPEYLAWLKSLCAGA